MVRTILNAPRAPRLRSRLAPLIAQLHRHSLIELNAQAARGPARPPVFVAADNRSETELAWGLSKLLQ